MRLALALLLALIASPAFAAVFTFAGKLNGRDIVVELTQPRDGAVAGRYAFLDWGADVPLVPVSSQDFNWVLHEEAMCGEDDCELADTGEVIKAPLAAVWEVSFDPVSFTASVTRTVNGPKSKPQGINLETIGWRPLDPSQTATATSLHERSVSYAYMNEWKLNWTTAPYEMTLLDVPLEESAPEEIDGAQFHYVTDPRTKFPFPRAISLPNDESVTRVNAILADHHRRMNLSALDCLTMVHASYGVNSEWSIMGGHLADYDNEQVTLTYLSPRLVSWTQSGSLYCTGAHPYNHYDSYTYDLETGDRLDPAKIIASWVPRQWGAEAGEIADVEIARANPDAYKWGPDQDLIAFVKERIPQDVYMGDAETDEICFGDNAIADHLDIRIVAGPKIMFTVSGYPHVMSVCTTDLFAASLDELKPFLAPTAADYFED